MRELYFLGYAGRGPILSHLLLLTDSAGLRVMCSQASSRDYAQPSQTELTSHNVGRTLPKGHTRVYERGFFEKFKLPAHAAMSPPCKILFGLFTCYACACQYPCKIQECQWHEGECYQASSRWSCRAFPEWAFPVTTWAVKPKGPHRSLTESVAILVVQANLKPLFD